MTVAQYVPTNESKTSNVQLLILVRIPRAPPSISNDKFYVTIIVQSVKKSVVGGANLCLFQIDKISLAVATNVYDHAPFWPLTEAMNVPN